MYIGSTVSAFSNSTMGGSGDGAFAEFCKLFDLVVMGISFSIAEDIKEINPNVMSASMYTGEELVELIAALVNIIVKLKITLDTKEEELET